MAFIKKEILPKKNIRLYLLYVIPNILLSLLMLPAFSQTYKNEAGATSDNDVYIAFLKDRYYTNGLFLHYRHALNQEKIRPELEKRIMEFEVGQKLYSPYYAQAPDPALHDRPFTAYLYAGSSFNWLYKNEKVIKVTAQIGTIGPNALGKEVQTAYHKLFGIYEVKGWEYQLKNEIGLNLAGEYSQLVYRTKSKKADIIAGSAALIGNTFSGANMNMMFRVGKINPIYQSISYNSIISNNPLVKEQPGKEFFLFTKPQLNYVAYDATIEGGLFREDKGPITFDSKHFVYSQQIGISYSTPRLTLSYIATFKGKEVQSTAEPYRYASLILLHRFK